LTGIEFINHFIDFTFFLKGHYFMRVGWLTNLWHIKMMRNVYNMVSV